MIAARRRQRVAELFHERRYTRYQIAEMLGATVEEVVADAQALGLIKATTNGVRNGQANLANDLAAALDPVAFARRLGIEPDDWQARFLRSPSLRVLMNCCRQSGKSTVAALDALHGALYTPRSLILLLSPAQRQSIELFRKCLEFYRAMNRPVPAEAENQMSLALENGSRIVSLPGNESTIRGYSGVRKLIVDEAAQVPDSLYKSVRPMLAVSGGSLDALSTPYGTSGWWSAAWHAIGTADRAERWTRIKITANQCPRISSTVLATEREELGDWWFRQEFMCQFMDDETAVFRSEDIERAFKPGVQAWAL
jgi:Terminase large subunit, T4likevirus-type, N-terminal